MKKSSNCDEQDQTSSSQARLIILNAGLPHNQKPGVSEASQLMASKLGRDSLDWVMMATGFSSRDITIVSGYQAKETRYQFQGVRLVENKNWQTTGSAGSLLCNDLRGLSDLLVCYGDILFHEGIVNQLRQSQNEITVAWDSRFRTRFADRPVSDLERCEKVIERDGMLQRAGNNLPVDWASGEFIGLVRFSGVALSILANLATAQKEILAQLSLADLVEWLRNQGHSVRGCDILGDWAELNEPHDIARFVLGTKAESLARLRKVVQKSLIQPQVAFSVLDWSQNPANIKLRIRKEFKGSSIIVRSSAMSEDSFLYSNAGAYTSILNIDPASDLDDVINKVINSYENKQPKDQVLAQPMVPNVVMSGVMFTRTLDFGAPYYVINYAENSETDAITGGKDTDSVTYVIRRNISMANVAQPHLRALLEAVNEIEALLSYDALDIEFAVDTAMNIYILQVRPITVAKSIPDLSQTCLAMIDDAKAKWMRCFPPRPQLKGAFPIYGVMPDWNPAEIIGTNAGRLAVSLYRYLITDDIWAQQRFEYGYKDVRPQPLLINFCGKNYVDVRASFNSFVPETVSTDLQERLVNFYLKRLKENPQFHDKVEFKILPTCLSFNTSVWYDRLMTTGNFDDADITELEEGLKQISQNAIARTQSDIETAEALALEFETVFASTRYAGIERARYLLELCRLKGTLPFAHLARSGFVAITLLRDAVERGQLSQAAQDAFLASIRTVSHEIMIDAAQVSQGDMAWEDLVSIYGHLRPGTYDIQSPAYFEDPEHYLRPIVTRFAPGAHKNEDISAWDTEKAGFIEAVAALGIDVPTLQIETFLRQAIEGREKSKFIFTRLLSAALNDILVWGEARNLSREDLAELTIEELIDVCDSVVPIAEQVRTLKKIAERARDISQVSAACQLPELIFEQQDFDLFRLREGQPNFIGTTSVQARCVVLKSGTQTSGDGTDCKLEGCVVMIPQADPGYDWLFGQNIGGFITMYGGTNSHMAIRAAEFELPAAIGVGEKIYNTLSAAQVIELNPLNKIIRSIN
jgi:choline kinase